MSGAIFPVSKQEIYISKMQDSFASGQPYELAILDYQMPGMTGLELASRIKADDTLRDRLLVMFSSEP